MPILLSFRFVEVIREKNIQRMLENEQEGHTVIVSRLFHHFYLPYASGIFIVWVCTSWASYKVWTHAGHFSIWTSLVLKFLSLLGSFQFRTVQFFRISADVVEVPRCDKLSKVFSLPKLKSNGIFWPGWVKNCGAWPPFLLIYSQCHTLLYFYRII